MALRRVILTGAIGGAAVLAAALYVVREEANDAGEMIAGRSPGALVDQIAAALDGGGEPESGVPIATSESTDQIATSESTGQIATGESTDQIAAAVRDALQEAPSSEFALDEADGWVPASGLSVDPLTLPPQQ